MKKCLLLACGLSLICAQEQGDEMRGVFANAGLEMWHKVALNPASQSLPNNTYGYTLGEANMGYKSGNFQAMIGGVGAGLINDSTKGLSFNHIGFYPGYYNSRASEVSLNNAHYIFVHNAFIKYEGESVSLSAGRFRQENDDWVDAYVEGVNARINAGDFYFKIFGTSGIALVGNGWLMDYNRLFAQQGIISLTSGYEGTNTKADVYVYYADREYIAPGFNVELDFGADSHFSSHTKLTAIFPYHYTSIMNIGKHYFANVGANNGVLKDISGWNASVLLRQDFKFDKAYNIALAVYKNFGAANSRVGQAGNPSGINFLDNSVYTTGPALNALTAPDAISGLFFSDIKISNPTKYTEEINFGLNLRYTSAPSALEYSALLHIDLHLNKATIFGVVAGYYIHTMKDGGLVGISPANFTFANGDSLRLDRSYITTRLSVGF